MSGPIILLYRGGEHATGAPDCFTFFRDRTRGLRRPGFGTGRCCTNRHGPARCPPTGSSPVEAIRHGSAEGGHPIEDRTADDDLTPLPSWAPGPEASSDHGRVSEARVLHPALTMVP